MNVRKCDYCSHERLFPRALLDHEVNRELKKAGWDVNMSFNDDGSIDYCFKCPDCSRREVRPC